MPQPLRKKPTPRRRKLIRWLGALVLIYAVIGFLVLPPIVRRVAVKQLSQQLDREVSIEQVKINPFVLSATVRGLLIKDKDGEPFASWDKAYVNFQLLSFLGHAWVFKEISLVNPFVRVQMNQDRSFNFSDLLAKFSNTNAPATNEPSQLLALRVDHLRIGGMMVAMTDLTPREPFHRRTGPLELTLENFSTEPGHANTFDFTGTTEAGEKIYWNGNFSLDPLRAQGEVKVFQLTLNKYAPLYQDLARFEIRDGTVAFVLKYRLDFNPTNRVTAVDDFAYALRDFKLGVPGESNNLVDLPLFAVTGASADLQQHTAVMDWVQLTGANIFVARDTNAAVNVVELAKPAESATNAPGGILFLLDSVTNAVARLLNSTNEWTGTIRNISLTNCAAHLEDHANPRPAKLDLSDITLDAKNLSNLAGTNLEASLSLRWNTNGALQTTATASFQPLAADVKLDIDRINLNTLDAYLADKLDLFILGSEVNLHGTLRLRPQVNDRPVISFKGDASLENFNTTDGVFGEDLLKWDALRFNGIVANLNPPLVAISTVVVDNAYARVVIETNRTLNLLNVLKLNPTNAPAKMEATSAVADNANSTNAPLQISIGAIIFTNTAVNFTDRSLQPNVTLSLQSLNGSVSGLSTEARQHAVVDLNAEVGGTAPVSIHGLINPLNGGQTNQIKISLKAMDLTPGGPYSGKFAGYRIAEGKLNLELAYDLVGKKLTSKNVITLDQFNFGEKVDSPDATHLPVRLAIAILKDREGKIVLDVPVEGSVDDPKFRVGKVVQRAILNILEKVATSPFSLLGAAFGGSGEELGFQDFAPGSASLTADDTKKLDTLVKALGARPALKLEIVGGIDPDGDREGLQRAALDQAIRERKWKKLRRTEQATNSVGQLVLTADDRAHYIPKFYAEAVAAKKITPELIAANTNLSVYAAQVGTRTSFAGKGAQGLMRTRAAAKNSKASPKPVTKLVPPPDPMEALLFATYPVSESDFETLAASRAKSVQSYLLQTGKLDASRIFIKAGGAETLRQDGSRAYLQLQ